MTKKSIEKRLDDLESVRGHLPIMVFEQDRKNPTLFRVKNKSGALMTEQEANDKFGGDYTLLFIKYRGLSETRPE